MKAKTKTVGRNSNGKGLAAYRPQVKNANRHKPLGMKHLGDSISAYGLADGITVAADGESISGAARLEKLAEMMPDAKVVEVPTWGETLLVNKRMDIPHADSPKGQRLSAAVNIVQHENYDPDGEILAALAAEDEVLKRMIEADDLSLRAIQEFAVDEPADAEPQTDRAEELRKKWKVKTGQLWALGEHRLVCGDCTDRAVVERLMGGEKAEFSFADPPYNVGISYTKETNDSKAREAFIEWCKLWVQYLPEQFCVTVGVKRLLWWRDILGDPQWIVAWVKMNGQSNTGLGGTNKWDPILVYGCKPDNQIDLIEVNNDYSEKLVSDGDHPTPKPVELWKQVINRFSERGKLIYDPFSGSGTTLVACQNLNRKCRAIEISPGYVSVALERMQTAFPHLPIELIDHAH